MLSSLLSSRVDPSHVERAHHCDDDQHYRAGRRGETHIEVLESGPVEEDRERLGRDARPTAGHDEDLVELPEGVHGSYEQYHGNDRSEQGQGDVPELAPPRCAVHPGGFEWLYGERFEPREQHEYGEGGPLPDVDEYDRGHRPRGVGEERDPLEADEREELVDDAVVTIQHEAVCGADYERGEDERNEDRGPGETSSPDVAPVE